MCIAGISSYIICLNFILDTRKKSKDKVVKLIKTLSAFSERNFQIGENKKIFVSFKMCKKTPAVFFLLFQDAFSNFNEISSAIDAEKILKKTIYVLYYFTKII